VELKLNRKRPGNSKKLFFEEYWKNGLSSKKQTLKAFIKVQELSLYPAGIELTYCSQLKLL
jgi:hypothetical protein